MKKYSVIIPCLNEAQVLEQTLISLNTAITSRSDVEVLLIDNGSTDASLDIAKRHGVKVMQISGVPIAVVRNFGAQNSEGDFILFLDADIHVPVNWFQLLDHYADGDEADVVGFVDRVPDSAPWFARIWGLRATARRQRLMRIDALPGRNLMLSRHWFNQVGGFNESLITGEDKEFVYRLHLAGAKVLSVPGAELFHFGYEKTFGEWCRKEYWRQHSHISLLQSQGVRMRLMRFPMLAVTHILLLLMVLISWANADMWVLLWFTLWWIPSLGMSLKNKISRAPLLRLVQFCFLYWVRFHIAGISVLFEFWEKGREGKLQWS